jgi:hypothetical protein
MPLISPKGCNVSNIGTQRLCQKHILCRMMLNTPPAAHFCHRHLHDVAVGLKFGGRIPQRQTGSPGKGA